MQYVLWLGPGVVAAVAIYVVVYAIRHGVPAAVTMVKNWWSKGKADYALLKQDVDALKAGLDTVKQKLNIQ